MRYLLNILYFLGLILGLPFLIYKMFTAGKYRRGLGQRLGRLGFAPDRRPLIWLHAVSVGELQAAKGLVAKLRQAHPDHQIVISHTTRTGEAVAAELYPDLARFYSPLDFSWVVAGIFRRLKPKLVILMELELWPNFLTAAKRGKIPILLANGRISERSGRGYARNAWFFAAPFRALTRGLMQNQEYLERMTTLFEAMKLPVERLEIGGNIKFENLPAGRDSALRAEYRKLFGFGATEIVVIAGSTHPGEHEILVEMIKRLGAKIRLILVPRHPERWGEVRKLWKASGLSLVDRSGLSADAPNGNSSATILLDTMGELGKVYHAADIAFIGGSLIPHGGQNMLESCAAGLPTLFGPNTANFRSIVRDLLSAKGAREVADAAALEAAILELASDAETRHKLGLAARGVIDSGQGAIDKHLAAISEMLSKAR